MWAVVGRHGFAVTLLFSVALHAAVAAWFSLNATEPPAALPSFAGKASMSIRASPGARPRVVGDGASVGSSTVRTPSGDRPALAGARAPEHRNSPDRAASPMQRRPGEAAPERNAAPVRTGLAPPPQFDSHPATHTTASAESHPPTHEIRDAAVAPTTASTAPPDHAAGQTITALSPATGADHSREEAAPTKPPPHADRPTPKDHADAPPVAVAAPQPTPVAQAPIRKPGEDAPVPKRPTDHPLPKPSQTGVQPEVASAPPHVVATPKEPVAGDRPSTKPGRPTLPGLENVKNVADEASAPSPGSAGSEGVEADDLPRGLAVNPPPPYPDDALANRLEGSVLLWVKIDATGHVSSIRVQESSGIESLDRSALNTIRRWQFSPAKRRGIAVPYEFYWPVRFRIPGR